MALTLPHARRFSRQEYYRMAESGVLGAGERVELIEGEVVCLPAHTLAHSLSLRGSTRLLTQRFGATHIVSCQLPLTLVPNSEPEPDLALFTPQHELDCARRGEHPSRPDLVIEIADTSLSYDRHEKASLYARAGIPEYWILNLKRRCLELRTDPGPDPDAPLGHAYRTVRIVAEGDALSPGFCPGTAVGVAELLPPADLG